MKNFSGLTITGATPDGYSVKANGYVKGSWLQSSVMQNYGSNTGKVCVFDGAGWIYYRTPAEIVAEAGGGGSTEVVQTTGTSTTSVMSQKATTDELAKKANLNGGNTFKGGQEITRDDMGTLLNVTNALGDSFFQINQNANNPDGGIFIGMDTAQTPISFDGDFGLEGQALLSRGSGYTPMWGDITKHGYTQLTNEDLNTITEAGWYNAAQGNTCTNRPSQIGANAFILIVEKNADTYIKQTVYLTADYSGEYKLYVRYYKGSSWIFWSLQQLLSNGTPQTFSGYKTFNDGISFHGPLSVSGSEGMAGQVLMSTGPGTSPVWKNIGGDMPTIRLVSVKDTTGTGICGPNNPLRFSFVVESGTLLDTDYVELCSRTLFTYGSGHYLDRYGNVQDFGRTYKLRAFHRVAVSNLTNDEGFYKFEIGGGDSNFALRQFVRSNMPTPISKSPYSITKYLRIMRNPGSAVPKNIHSNVIPIYVAPTKPVLDASTNRWSAKIRIR